MKKTMLLFVLISIALFSCKKEKDETNELVKKYTQLEKANWFLGNWENITKEMDMKEIWKKENDSSYIAESFVVVQKDTVFYEKIDLVERNDSLYYIVSVRNQNKEKPVSFYLTTSTNNELVFENPKHDFPNKIVYNKITNDSIVAEIFGTQNGKEAKESFPMRKK